MNTKLILLAGLMFFLAPVTLALTGSGVPKLLIVPGLSLAIFISVTLFVWISSPGKSTAKK